MSIVRLVWRTDVHLSDHAPASRRDDWTDSLLEKLAQIKVVAGKLKVSGLLDGGDFFHTKSPSRNSHRLVQTAATHHADYPCPIFCTPGNHDSVYGDYTFLEQQPLGVLFASGVFNRLYDQYEVVFSPDGFYRKQDGDWLEGDPFALGAQRPLVRVVGIPYHGTRYDISRLQSINKGQEDYLVCVAHILASPQGGQMFEGEDIWSYRDLVGYAPDVFCVGHWHKNQGVSVLGGKHIVNIGSLSRGALVQDDLDRLPSIAVLSFTEKGIDIRTAYLKVKPAIEVFDLESHAKAETRSMTLDAFVASVRETLVETRGESLEASVAGLDISDEVRERALLYLERT